MVSKYGHLMLPGAFADKVTPDIDFTDKEAARCDVLKGPYKVGWNANQD